MKKEQEIIFYQDYFSDEAFEDIKANLFYEYADYYKWETVDEVPDEQVWEELNEQYREDWHYLETALKEEFKRGLFILVGSTGRWDGNYACGQFISSFQDLMRGLRHLDQLRFYERNGHFYIEGSHHDGSDSYEMKRLTNKGLQLAEKHDFAHDRKLHQTIMSYNFYSALPRFGRTFAAL